MPFQVSGQLVTTKSSRLPHVAGAFAVAAGAAFVTMMSSADASVAYAAPASPKIIDAKTPTFFILPLPSTIGREAVPGPHIPQQLYSVNRCGLRRRDEHKAAVSSRSKR